MYKIYKMTEKKVDNTKATLEKAVAYVTMVVTLFARNLDDSYNYRIVNEQTGEKYVLRWEKALHIYAESDGGNPRDAFMKALEAVEE